MNENPSKRVVLQRLRNRRLEACELLADGDGAVRLMGASEYFNWFYDWFPDEGQLKQCPTETAEENEALNDVLTIMNTALEDTYDLETIEELISSGWPTRIQPVALKAVQTLLIRGRFDEEVEQENPEKPTE